MVACDAAGIVPVVPVDSQGKFTTEVPDYVGQLVFDANKPIIADLKAGTGPLARVADGPAQRRGAPRDVRALLPALLALPEPAHLQGGDQLVRARERLPRPHGRAQPGHRLDAGAHQGRPVRQVALQRARLVDQPQPLLGHAHPRVGVGRPGAPARRRLRLAGRAGGGLRPRADERGGRAGPAPPVHRRADAPEPGRPVGRVDDAPDPRRARRVVRLGLDAVRAGALPVRERGLVRAPLPGRLHRRVHRPDPRLVLHAARAGHGAVRPPVVPQRPVPRHRAGRRRPQGQQVAAELPGPGADVGRVRLGRRALVPHVELDPARGQPHRRRGGHPRRRAPGAAAAVEHVLLLHAVRGCGGRRSRLRREAGRRGTRGHARADGPVRPGAHAGPRGDAPRSSWTPTTSRRRARRCASTSTS